MGNQRNTLPSNIGYYIRTYMEHTYIAHSIKFTYANIYVLFIHVNILPTHIGYYIKTNMENIYIAYPTKFIYANIYVLFI